MEQVKQQLLFTFLQVIRIGFAGCSLCTMRYREFLEFFQLDYTLAVFDPETNIGKDFQYRGRTKLIDALGLTELVDAKSPLLSEIMRLSKVSTTSLKIYL